MKPDMFVENFTTLLDDIRSRNASEINAPSDTSDLNNSFSPPSWKQNTPIWLAVWTSLLDCLKSLLQKVRLVAPNLSRPRRPSSSLYWILGLCLAWLTYVLGRFILDLNAELGQMSGHEED